MAMHLEDLVSVAVFSAVAETSSFTAAAKRLDLSKAAVSARVARLEERLGARLLNRTTRRVTLTETGLEVYRRSARILADADAATASARDLSPEPHGVLRVNAPVVLGERVLARALAELTARYPTLQVELTVDDRLVDVTHGGWDLVVRVSSGKIAEANVSMRKLGTSKMVACASRAYLEREGTPRDPTELPAHHCLRYTLATPTEEWRFRQRGKWQHVPVRGRFGANSGLLLVEAALAGLGIVIVPRFMVDADLARGTLVRILEGFEFAELGIYALHPHGKSAPARVRVAIEHLARVVPAALRGA